MTRAVGEAFPGSAAIDYSHLAFEELQHSTSELKSDVAVFLNTGRRASSESADRHCLQIASVLELLEARGARLIIEEIRALLQTQQRVEQLSAQTASNAIAAEATDTTSPTEAGLDPEQPMRDTHVMLLLACERLSEYLDYLKTGGKDQVPALLPLVNNLRACRGAHLLSENLLAGDAFDVPEVTDTLVAGADARNRFFKTVRECRHPFMQAVLLWYQSDSILTDENAAASGAPKEKDKGKRSGKKHAQQAEEKDTPQNEADSRETLLSLLQRLEAESPNASLQAFWGAARVVCTGVLNGSLENGPAICQLFGQLERYLKELLDYQLEAGQLRLPVSLYKNLLYYAALSGDADQRVAELCERFGLDKLIPDETAGPGFPDTTQSGSRWRADNAVLESLDKEVTAIREFVSDYADTGLPEAEAIVATADRLEQVSATFLLLGDSKAEDTARESADILRAAATEPDPVRLQTLATHLLHLGETLDAHRHTGRDRLFVGDFSRDMLDQRQLSAHAMDQIVRRCLDEARGVLNGVRSRALERLPQSAESLDTVQQALKILPLPELTPMLSSAADYLRWYYNEYAESHTERSVSPQVSRCFADLLVNTSAYLDGDVQTQSAASDLLQNAELAMEQLVDAMSQSDATAASAVHDASVDPLTIDGDGFADDEHLEQTGHAEQTDRTEAHDETGQKDTTLSQKAINFSESRHSTTRTGLSETAENPARDPEDNQHTPPADSMPNQFIESALKRFDTISRCLGDWNKPRERQTQTQLESLESMRDEYAGLATLAGAHGPATWQLVQFAQANEHMLTRVIQSNERYNPQPHSQPNPLPLAKDAELLMQESVAVLPQLLNQLPGNFEPTTSSQRAVNLSGATITKENEAVSGLAVLMHRLRLVETHADDAIASSVSAHGVRVTPTVARDATAMFANASADSHEPDVMDQTVRIDRADIDGLLHPDLSTQDKHEATHAELTALESATQADTVALEIDRESLTPDVENAEATEAGTWAFGASSPKTTATAFSESPRINTPLRPSRLGSPATPGQSVSASVASSHSVTSEDATLALDSDEFEESHGITPASKHDWTEGGLTTAGLPDLDSTLFSVFEAECSGHIATLRGISDTVVKTGTPVPVAERFMQALHTLNGSALAAGEAGIVDIAEPLEQLAAHYHRQSAIPELKAWNEFATAIDALANALDARSVGADAESITSGSSQRLRELLQAQKIRVPHRTRDSLGSNESTESNESNDARNSPASTAPAPASRPPSANAPAATAVSRPVAPSHDRKVQLYDVFLDEASGLLGKMQTAHDQIEPLKDETTPLAVERKDAQLRDVLRQLHTLKGSARVAGCDALATLGHNIETTLMSWRHSVAAPAEGIAASRGIDAVRVELLQASIDAMVINLEQARGGDELGHFDMLVAELQQDLEQKDLHIGQARQVSESDDEVEATVELDATMELSADDQIAGTAGLEATVLNQVLSATRGDTTLFDAEEHPAPEVLEHTAATLDLADDPLEEPLVELLDDTAAANQHSQDASIANSEVQPDSIQLDSAVVRRLSGLSSEISVHHARLGQGLHGLQDVLIDLDRTTGSLRQKLRDLDYEAAVLPQAGDELDQTLHTATAAGEAETGTHVFESRQHSEADSRQLTEILHDLDMIRDSLHERLRAEEETLSSTSRLGADIHESIVQVNMLRFDGLAQRLESTVRQCARQLGKSCELEITGGSISIDRELQRKLAAPLEHLIRNAIAHGIEAPATRLKLGKPETGRISIRVALEGTDLCLEVHDDGGGIDLAKVRSVAGMTNASDEAVMRQLMQGGISTRESVDEIAGRGIGLNSTAELLGELDADIDIAMTNRSGTCFRITVPQNVLINHAVVAEFNGFLLGIPANNVRGVFSLEDKAQSLAPGRLAETLDVGALLGLDALPVSAAGARAASDWLVQNGEGAQCIHIVADGRDIYLEPQRVLGFRDLITRPVGSQLASLGVYSGASLQSDGSKVMVLDARRLLGKYETSLASGFADNRSATSTRDFVDRIDFDQTRAAQAGIAAVEAGNRDATTGVKGASRSADKNNQQPAILVVDNSVTLRTHTSQIAQGEGYTTIEARDGYEALEALKRMPVPPLAVITDIEMPRMDGFQLIEALKGMNGFEDLPVILISSRSGTYNRLRASELSVHGFLGKPFDPDDLAGLLKQLEPERASAELVT